MSTSDYIAAGSVVAALASAVFAARNSKRANDTREGEVEIERAKELRADASDARNEARAARREAGEARTVAAEAHRRADEVVSYLGWILRLINDPTMTIDQLRAEVRDSMPPVSVGAAPRKD